MKNFDVTLMYQRERRQIASKGREVKNILSSKISRFSSITPTIFLMVSCLLITFILGISSYYNSFYYTVYLNGEAIGLVEDSSVVEEYKQELLSEQNKKYQSEVYSASNVSFSEPKFHAITEDNLDEVKTTMDQEIDYYAWAFLVNIDDRETVCLNNPQSYDEVLEQIKAGFLRSRVQEQNIIEIETAETVKGEWVQVEPTEIMSTEEAFAYLAPSSSNPERVMLSSRGSRSGDTQEDESGDNEDGNFINIISVEEIVEEEAIDYDTEYKYDDNMMSGESEVETSGSEGLKEIVYHITRENDREIKEEKVEEEVVEEPQTEIIVKGTKNKTYSSHDVRSGSGNFIWPIPGSYDGGGSITRGFTGAHSGVDIYASTLTNTPIVAADSGTVAAAHYDGAYGNTVVINHGSYYTVYAHCSSMEVSSGQSVSQGETIAYMGNTGRTYGRTGIHLHFEVRRNNGANWKAEDPVNPMSFF